MSGENQRDDDPDFLDDDFIIEDIAAKNEELDSLFEAPPAPAVADDPNAPPATPLAGTDAAGAAPDAEDLLFTDHSREPKFEGKPQFAEEEASTWDGQGLDLGAMHEGDAGKIAAKAEGEGEDGVLAAAEQSFTKELDSLLKGEDDFGPDTEEDLEVIGGDPNAPSNTPSDGIAEFEQSGPFVLDDGDGAWQEENTAAEATESESTELELGVPLQAAASEEAAEVEPGWEPLPASNVDQLAEVGEVARTDEDSEPQVDAQDFTAPTFGGARRPALVGAGAAEEVEGHDIYAEEEVAEVVGTTAEPRRSTFRLVLSLAATLCVLAGGAVVVLKPEWLGMGASPERLQQVEVARPTVAVNVPVPAPIVDPNAGETRPDKPTVAVGTDPTSTPPVPTEPPAPAVVVVPEPEKVPPPEPVPSVPPVAVEPPPPAVVTTPEQPTQPTPEPTVPTVVVAPSPETGWPVREVVPVAQVPGTDRQNLLRVNENLLIGDVDPSGAPRAHTTEGVMPGSRAFAQLSNGNYFIGSVKTVDSERLTLNVDTGEVTLPVAALARLTELGSADYAELQRVTSGFVRLTNNNRLVGGILSGIADDHVVLEFRSNRVMLPKSLVGQVVQGENDAAVRLDTTSEEDDWLRRLVERQVGNGAPPVPQAPVKSTPQVPANPLPAPSPSPSPSPPSTGRSPR